MSEDLRVESELGKGTLFRVELPAARLERIEWRVAVWPRRSSSRRAKNTAFMRQGDFSRQARLASAANVELAADSSGGVIGSRSTT